MTCSYNGGVCTLASYDKLLLMPVREADHSVKTTYHSGSSPFSRADVSLFARIQPISQVGAPRARQECLDPSKA
jgi:hypothetical protein